MQTDSILEYKHYHGQGYLLQQIQATLALSNLLSDSIFYFVTMEGFLFYAIVVFRCYVSVH